MMHPAAHTLVVDPWVVRQQFIQTGAGGGGQILYGFQKIRLLIPEPFQGGVVFDGYTLTYPVRYPVQQIIRKDTSSVGRVDGGQGSHVRRGPAPGDGVAAVQTALGVGDDIYLLTACFREDLPDAPGQFLSAFRHGSGRLLIAVEKHGPVSFQFAGDPAPVLEEPEVPEEDAVHEKDRVSGMTFLILGPDPVQQILLLFQQHFAAGDADDPAQYVEVYQRHKTADDPDHPPPDPQLCRSQVDAQNPVPEQKKLHEEDTQKVAQPERPRRKEGDTGLPEDDNPEQSGSAADGFKDRGREEDLQQGRTVFQNFVAGGGSPVHT